MVKSNRDKEKQINEYRKELKSNKKEELGKDNAVPTKFNSSINFIKRSEYGNDNNRLDIESQRLNLKRNDVYKYRGSRRRLNQSIATSISNNNSNNSNNNNTHNNNNNTRFLNDKQHNTLFNNDINIPNIDISMANDSIGEIGNIWDNIQLDKYTSLSRTSDVLGFENNSFSIGLHIDSFIEGDSFISKYNWSNTNNYNNNNNNNYGNNNYYSNYNYNKMNNHLNSLLDSEIDKDSILKRRYTNGSKESIDRNNYNKYNDNNNVLEWMPLDMLRKLLRGHLSQPLPSNIISSNKNSDTNFIYDRPSCIEVSDLAMIAIIGTESGAILLYDFTKPTELARFVYSKSYDSNYKNKNKNFTKSILENHSISAVTSIALPQNQTVCSQFISGHSDGSIHVWGIKERTIIHSIKSQYIPQIDDYLWKDNMFINKDNNNVHYKSLIDKQGIPNSHIYGIPIIHLQYISESKSGSFISGAIDGYMFLHQVHKKTILTENITSHRINPINQQINSVSYLVQKVSDTFNFNNNTIPITNPKEREINNDDNNNDDNNQTNNLYSFRWIKPSTILALETFPVDSSNYIFGTKAINTISTEFDKKIEPNNNNDNNNNNELNDDKLLKSKSSRLFEYGKDLASKILYKNLDNENNNRNISPELFIQINEHGNNSNMGIETPPVILPDNNNTLIDSELLKKKLQMLNKKECKICGIYNLLKLRLVSFSTLHNITISSLLSPGKVLINLSWNYLKNFNIGQQISHSIIQFKPYSSDRNLYRFDGTIITNNEEDEKSIVSCSTVSWYPRLLSNLDNVDTLNENKYSDSLILALSFNNEIKLIKIEGIHDKDNYYCSLKKFNNNFTEKDIISNCKASSTDLIKLSIIASETFDSDILAMYWIDSRVLNCVLKNGQSLFLDSKSAINSNNIYIKKLKLVESFKFPERAFLSASNLSKWNNKLSFESWYDIIKNETVKANLYKEELSLKGEIIDTNVDRYISYNENIASKFKPTPLLQSGLKCFKDKFFILISNERYDFISRSSSPLLSIKSQTSHQNLDYNNFHNNLNINVYKPFILKKFRWTSRIRHMFTNDNREDALLFGKMLYTGEKHCIVRDFELDNLMNTNSSIKIRISEFVLNMTKMYLQSELSKLSANSKVIDQDYEANLYKIINTIFEISIGLNHQDVLFTDMFNNIDTIPLGRLIFFNKLLEIADSNMSIDTYLSKGDVESYEDEEEEYELNKDYEKYSHKSNKPILLNLPKNIINLLVEECLISKNEYFTDSKDMFEKIIVYTLHFDSLLENELYLLKIGHEHLLSRLLIFIHVRRGRYILPFLEFSSLIGINLSAPNSVKLKWPDSKNNRIKWKVHYQLCKDNENDDDSDNEKDSLKLIPIIKRYTIFPDGTSLTETEDDHDILASKLIIEDEQNTESILFSRIIVRYLIESLKGSVSFIRHYDDLKKDEINSIPDNQQRLIRELLFESKLTNLSINKDDYIYLPNSIIDIKDDKIKQINLSWIKLPLLTSILSTSKSISSILYSNCTFLIRDNLIKSNLIVDNKDLFISLLIHAEQFALISIGEFKNAIILSAAYILVSFWNNSLISKDLINQLDSDTKILCSLILEYLLFQRKSVTINDDKYIPYGSFRWRQKLFYMLICKGALDDFGKENSQFYLTDNMIEQSKSLSFKLDPIIESNLADNKDIIVLLKLCINNNMYLPYELLLVRFKINSWYILRSLILSSNKMSKLASFGCLERYLQGFHDIKNHNYLLEEDKSINTLECIDNIEQSDFDPDSTLNLLSVGKSRLLELFCSGYNDSMEIFIALVECNPTSFSIILTRNCTLPAINELFQFYNIMSSNYSNNNNVLDLKSSLLVLLNILFLNPHQDLYISKIDRNNFVNLISHETDIDLENIIWDRYIGISILNSDLLNEEYINCFETKWVKDDVYNLMPSFIINLDGNQDSDYIITSTFNTIIENSDSIIFKSCRDSELPLIDEISLTEGNETIEIGINSSIELRNLFISLVGKYNPSKISQVMNKLYDSALLKQDYVHNNNSNCVSNNIYGNNSDLKEKNLIWLTSNTDLSVHENKNNIAYLPDLSKFNYKNDDFDPPNSIKENSSVLTKNNKDGIDNYTLFSTISLQLLDENTCNCNYNNNCLINIQRGCLYYLHLKDCNNDNILVKTIYSSLCFDPQKDLYILNSKGYSLKMINDEKEDGMDRDVSFTSDLDSDIIKNEEISPSIKSFDSNEIDVESKDIKTIATNQLKNISTSLLLFSERIKSSWINVNIESNFISKLNPFLYSASLNLNNDKNGDVNKQLIYNCNCKCNCISKFKSPLILLDNVIPKLIETLKNDYEIPLIFNNIDKNIFEDKKYKIKIWNMIRLMHNISWILCINGRLHDSLIFLRNRVIKYLEVLSTIIFKNDNIQQDNKILFKLEEIILINSYITLDLANIFTKTMPLIPRYIISNENDDKENKYKVSGKVDIWINLLSTGLDVFSVSINYMTLLMNHNDKIKYEKIIRDSCLAIISCSQISLEVEPSSILSWLGLVMSWPPSNSTNDDQFGNLSFIRKEDKKVNNNGKNEDKKELPTAQKVITNLIKQLNFQKESMKLLNDGIEKETIDIISQNVDLRRKKILNTKKE